MTEKLTGIDKSKKLCEERAAYETGRFGIDLSKQQIDNYVELRMISGIPDLPSDQILIDLILESDQRPAYEQYYNHTDFDSQKEAIQRRLAAHVISLQ